MKSNIDRYISMILGLQYSLIATQYLIQMFIPEESTFKLIVSFLFKAVLGVLMFLVVRQVIEKKMLLIYITYFLAILLLAWNYTMFPENITYIKEFQLDFLLISLTSFIYVYAINDYKHLIKSLYKSAFFVSIMVTIIYVVKVFLLNDDSYSLYLSYIIIFAVILNMDNFIYNKRSFFIGILIITNVGAVLHVGSRGAILCLITYMGLSLLLRSNKSFVRRILYIIPMLVIALFFQDIFIKLNELLNNFGVSSRTIANLARDEVYLSGRDILYENTINAITNNDITGIGLAGDRIINGTYSHNIILEILATFGVYLGSFLLLMLVILLINGCVLTKNKNIKTLSIIYFSYSIPMLMVSRTLWSQGEFWILLALCIKGTTFLIDKKSNYVLKEAG